MTYEIKFSNSATKHIRKFDEILKERIKGKFRKLVEDPFRFLEHYEGESLFKFRVGGYRALIEFDSKNKTLFVKVFDKRSRVYKKK